jgi:hypothetical protein
MTARPRLTFFTLALICASSLAGCQVIGSGQLGFISTGQPAYQPDPDGPSAVTTALIRTEFPNQHGVAAGAPGGVAVGGPGVAGFLGPFLEFFSAPGLHMIRDAEAGGSILEEDGDALIIWGRWGGTLSSSILGGTRALPADAALHYVVGQATPNANLPAQGTASFSLLGATMPTFGDRGPRARFHEVRSAALAVVWGGASANTKVGLVMDLSADMLYTLGSNGGLTNPALSEIVYNPAAQCFQGLIGVSAEATSSVACRGSTTCSALIVGFFAGQNAELAGLTYTIGDAAVGGPDTGSSLFGAAVFANHDVVPVVSPPPATVTLLDQSDPNAFAITFAHSGMLAQPKYGPAATATQSASAQLETFAATGGSPGNQVDITRGTAQSPAGETGGDSLITWGRWTNGTTTGTAGVGPLALGPNQGFHYVVGAATPAAGMPASGTATFTLMGATKPTFGDGALAPGTFTGSMAVQWGGAAATKVGIDFNITMPGDASYRLMSAGGVATPGTSLISTSLASGSAFSGPANVTVTGTGRACPGACSGNVNGFFAGPSAERAGAVYMIGLGGTGIQGAAAFTR